MKKRSLMVLFSLVAVLLLLLASPLGQKKVQAQGEQYQYAQVGSPVYLSAGGGSAYQWQYSDNHGQSWSNSTEPGAATSQLQTTMTLAHHNRMYRCRVTIGIQNVNTGVIILRALATWTQQPEPVSAKVGEKVSMTAKATAPEGIMSYQWQYSYDNGATWKNSSSSGAKTSTVKFTMQAGYQGMYWRCLATDIYGQESYSSGAGVAVQPEWIKHPENQSGKVGEYISYSVKFSGAKPTYQWQYSDDNGQTWKNSSSSGAKTATVKFKVAASYNGRRWRCVVTEANGFTLTSLSATTRVLSEITAQPQDQAGKVNEKVSFAVGATGPSLKYQWQYSYDNGATWKNSGSSGAKTATVTFTVKNSYNGIVYRCLITDANGVVLISNPASLTVTK